MEYMCWGEGEGIDPYISDTSMTTSMKSEHIS